ncbi:MAG TPA: hypothetical protein V6C86_14800 [Oculatellaceae cyanobacterium]
MNAKIAHVVMLCAVVTGFSSSRLVFATDAAPQACACMASDPNAAQKKKHKGGPVRHVLKGLEKEFGSDLSNMGKDAMFVFSAQDFDPYASTPTQNPKRPYVIGDIEFVDGSKSEIVRFPDRSLRIYGGFEDGTYACPRTAEGNTYDVRYPNGANGVLAFSSDGSAVVKRPDGTTTKISKTAGGGYKVTNDKLGYIGDINTDETGLNHEFARSNNPVNNLQ